MGELPPPEARILACVFPDWSATAAARAENYGPEKALVIVSQHRIRDTNWNARRSGIRRGMRVKDAQACCPGLVVVESDPARDVRYFEPFARRCENVTPFMEILRPGLITMRAHSLAEFYGGEEDACETVLSALEDSGQECHLGIADTLAAACWAARRDALVPAGKTPDFVATLPLQCLTAEPVLPYAETRAEIVSVGTKVGFRTLGDFTSVPRADVVQRFGAGAQEIYDMACGEWQRDRRGVSSTELPQELTVEQLCDPPLQRMDEAAFLARTLGVQLQEILTAHAVACTSVEVGIETSAETCCRVWRCAKPLSATEMADRLRWQIEGWLTPVETTFRNEAIMRVWMRPVAVHGGMQQDLWHAESPQDTVRDNCISRVRGLLGEKDVLSAIPSGGWDPAAAVAWIPYGEQPPAHHRHAASAPWQGVATGLRPSTSSAITVELVGQQQEPVEVRARGTLSSSPKYLERDGCMHTIANWAGPWAYLNEWWESFDHRCAHLQVELASRELYLLMVRQGQWFIAGQYN